MLSANWFMHALNICRGLCSISTSKHPANLRFALKCEGGKGRAVIQLHALNVESWSHAKKGMVHPLKAFLLLSCCPACWPAEGLTDSWSPLGHKTGQKQSGKQFYSKFVSENLRMWNVYVCLFVWEGVLGESWVTDLSLTLHLATKGSVDFIHIM